MPPPEVKATRCEVLVERRRPTAANPRGSIREVTIGPYVPPSGAVTAVKRLADAAGDPEIIVTYARGVDIAGNGSPVRAPLWELREQDEHDRRRRVQVGSREPEPVDSFAVRGVWPKACVVGGWWLDGAPDVFQAWTPDVGIVALEWTGWASLLSEFGRSVEHTALIRKQRAALEEHAAMLAARAAARR